VGKPVNVLAYPTATVAELIDAGAQRISVGGSLTWTAVEAMASAAEQIRDQGDFSALASPSRIREWLAR
jgi:2-methylisocitrate lyase-like PEP mutase family enzyme